MTRKRWVKQRDAPEGRKGTESVIRFLRFFRLKLARGVPLFNPFFRVDCSP